MVVLSYMANQGEAVPPENTQCSLISLDIETCLKENQIINLYFCMEGERAQCWKFCSLNILNSFKKLYSEKSVVKVAGTMIIQSLCKASHEFSHCGNPSCPLELEVGQGNLYSFLFDQEGFSVGGCIPQTLLWKKKEC